MTVEGSLSKGPHVFERPFSPRPRAAWTRCMGFFMTRVRAVSHRGTSGGASKFPDPGSFRPGRGGRFPHGRQGGGSQALTERTRSGVLRMHQRFFAPATALRLLVFALSAALPASALANAFDFYGFGTRGMGMAGTQAASADDYSAAYFNPSLLAYQKKTKVGLSFTWIDRHLSASALSDDMRPLHPVNPKDSYGVSLGFVLPFGGAVQDRISLGVGAYLPTSSLMKVQSVDPMKPNWYLQQGDSDRLALAVSLGFRITDWVSLGLGVQVLGGITGSVEMSLNADDYVFEQRDVLVEVNTAVSPIAGFTFRFQPIGLSVGFGYRGSMKIDYELPVTVHAKGDFGDGYKELALVDVTVGGTIFYSPHTLTLGVEWQGLQDRLTVSAELRYAFWSKAPDPTVGLKVGLTSEMDLVTEVLGEDFNVRAGGEDIRLSDTLSVRAGVEYWLVPEVLNLRGGYAYTPTPVPVQNGRTNLLDSDSHMIALGSTVYFHDPLDIFKEAIAFALAIQMHFFPEREANKSANYDIASYTYGGYVGTLSASLAYAF